MIYVGVCLISIVLYIVCSYILCSILFPWYISIIIALVFGFIYLKNISKLSLKINILINLIYFIILFVVKDINDAIGYSFLLAVANLLSLIHSYHEIKENMFRRRVNRGKDKLYEIIVNDVNVYVVPIKAFDYECQRIIHKYYKKIMKHLDDNDIDYVWNNIFLNNKVMIPRYKDSELFKRDIDIMKKINSNTINQCSDEEKQVYLNWVFYCKLNIPSEQCVIITDSAHKNYYLATTYQFAIEKSKDAYKYYIYSKYEIFKDVYKYKNNKVAKMLDENHKKYFDLFDNVINFEEKETYK